MLKWPGAIGTWAKSMLSSTQQAASDQQAFEDLESGNFEVVVHCTEAPIQTPTWQWDAPRTLDTDQFVNLPAHFEAPYSGRRVTLRGHVQPRTANVTVQFTVHADGGNHATAGNATLVAVSAITDHNGDAQAQVDLTEFGGARYRVGGKTATMPLAALSGWITVWRKIYYQITTMANSPPVENLAFTEPPGLIAALRQSFDPVFFRLSPGVTHAAATPYQAHLTAAQRDTLEAQLALAGADAYSPFKLNVVLIDTADVVAEQEWLGTGNTGATAQTPSFAFWAHDPVVVEAEYESDWGPMYALDAGAIHVRVDPLDGTRRFVEVDIPADVPDPGAVVPVVQRVGVNVRVKYRYKSGNGGGWAGRQGATFICVGHDRRANALAPPVAVVRHVLVHEIGHNLGLVPAGAAWHDTDPRDAPYNPKHCGHLTAGPLPQPMCVMWWTGYTTSNFCSHAAPNDCSHHLKATGYSNLNWI